MPKMPGQTEQGIVASSSRAGREAHPGLASGIRGSASTHPEFREVSLDLYRALVGPLAFGMLS
eukprot:2034606-Pyramimonas_sp.AAC.1